MKDDLSNAIVATCKAPGWKRVKVPVPNPNAIIYDPVIHQDVDEPPLLETEHQVTQHQHGKVKPTDGSDGPKGTWAASYPKYMNDQWAPLPALPAGY